MRRFDKSKHIERANLLAEERHLASKGLLKEEKPTKDESTVEGYRIEDELFPEYFHNYTITDRAHDSVFWGMEMTFESYSAGGLLFKLKRSGKSQNFKVYRKSSNDSEWLKGGNWNTVENPERFGFNVNGPMMSVWKLVSTK